MKRIKPIHIAVLFVVALIALAFFRFSGNAKAAESGYRPACNFEWYAMKLRAEGKNQTKALRMATEAIPWIRTNKQYRHTQKEGPTLEDRARRAVMGVYHDYSRAEAKDRMDKRTEMNYVCTQLFQITADNKQ